MVDHVYEVLTNPLQTVLRPPIQMPNTEVVEPVHGYMWSYSKDGGLDFVSQNCCSFICLRTVKGSYLTLQSLLYEKFKRHKVVHSITMLPNIHKLKPEQEQVLLSFVGGHVTVVMWQNPHGVREQFDFPATAASSVTVVVKELAKANASDWLWQIRVALGRSNSFKL